MNTTKFLCKYFSEDNEHNRVTCASIIQKSTIYMIIIGLFLCMLSSVYCIIYLAPIKDSNNIIFSPFGIVGFFCWFFVIVGGVVFGWEWMENKVIVTCPKDKE